MGRRYKCKYCDNYFERDKLIDHINHEHEELIPQGYTATRVVFNMINKKKHGSCVICGRITKWNETSGHYDRLCSQECIDKYKEKLNKDVIRVRGRSVQDMLNDPEHQKKMLDGRSISGEYKFKDGGIHTYVGKYEMNLLEFMDKVLDIPSKDIITPGPTIEYTYKGKTLKWITDIYYIPYNLVFDIKDGGVNPNTHPGYFINKQKQTQKELAIEQYDKYNYIRLTDNNFDQLLYILVELKNKSIEGDLTKSIHINESAMIGIDTILYQQPYILTFIDKYEDIKFGILPSIYSDTVYVHSLDDFKFKEYNINTFKNEDTKILLFKILDKEKYYSLIESIMNKKEFVSNYPVLEFFDGYFINYNQLFYSEAYVYIQSDSIDIKEVIDLGYNDVLVDVIWEGYDNYKKELRKKYPNVSIMESDKGLRLVNKNTGLVSHPKYELIFDEFTKSIINFGE